MEQRLNGEYLRPGLLDRAAALALGAHDMHASLVLDAGGIGARQAKEIPIEVR